MASTPLFQGLGQQTPATLQTVRQAFGTARASGKKRSKGRKKKAAAPRAKKARKSKRPARLVKGSAEAKRYMASIRKKKRK